MRKLVYLVLFCIGVVLGWYVGDILSRPDIEDDLVGVVIETSELETEVLTDPIVVDDTVTSEEVVGYDVTTRIKSMSDILYYHKLGVDTFSEREVEDMIRLATTEVTSKYTFEELKSIPKDSLNILVNEQTKYNEHIFRIYKEMERLSIEAGYSIPETSLDGYVPGEEFEYNTDRLSFMVVSVDSVDTNPEVIIDGMVVQMSVKAITTEYK